MKESRKAVWGVILKLVIAMATSIAGVIGVSSCVR